MEVIGRVESGTETENESGDRVEGSTRTAHAHGWAVCSECMDAQDAYKEVGGRKRMERVFERRCPWMAFVDKCFCVFDTSATPLKGVPRSMAVVQ